MGRFELVIGEEQDGSPVYRQAHSGEMGERPSMLDYLMHRWEKSPYPLLTRSNDEWWVGVKGGRPLEEGVYLKASVMEGDPNQPPTTALCGYPFKKLH